MKVEAKAKRTYDRIHPTDRRRLAIMLNEVPKSRVIAIAVPKNDQALEILQVPGRMRSRAMMSTMPSTWTPWRRRCHSSRSEAENSEGNKRLHFENVGQMLKTNGRGKVVTYAGDPLTLYGRLWRQS